MKPISYALLIMSLSLCWTSVRAQAEKDDAETRQAGIEEIEEIIVSAARLGKSAKDIPIKIEVFLEDEIRLQQSLAANPVEMLSNLLPSFAPSRQKLTGSGETFRGRTPLYLVDGVPQSTPLRPGAREGFTIDMEVIERIEVLYGANAIQGLGGTGGVINYVTISPPRSGDAVQRASASVTSNDDFNGEGFGWRGHYLVGKRWDHVDATFSVSYEERGLLFDAKDRPIGIANMQGDVADSYSRNFFAKLGWEPSDTSRLQLTINDFYLEQNGEYVPVDGDRSIGLPTTSVKGNPEGDLPFNDTTNISLDYIHREFLNGSFAAQVYYSDFKSLFGGERILSFQDPAIAPVGTLFDQSQNNSEKIGVRLTYGQEKVGGSAFGYIVGFDYLRDKTSQPLVVTGRVSVPETTFFNYAPFVQLSYQATDWLSLSGGARWEVADLDVPDYTSRAGNRAHLDFLPVDVTGGKPGFDELLFNFGGVVDATETLSIYASYSEAFSMPDVGRVLRSVSEFDVRIDELLEIGPLVTENFEIGAEYALPLGRIGFAYFKSESDFGSRLIDRGDGTFDLARQATETSGWELSGEYSPVSWLSVGLGYSNLSGKFDSNRDGSVDTDLGASEIGPDRVIATLDFTPTGRYSGRLQAFTFFDRDFRNAAGDRTARFDGYTLVNAAVAAQFRNATLSLSVSNLLDKQYITYFAQAATTANSLYDAGRGRTITLRAQVDFGARN